DQCAIAIVQLERCIGEWIWNSVSTELRANGTNDHSLRSCALNNETAYHHVTARLNKAAGTDVAQTWRTCLHPEIVTDHVQAYAFWGGCGNIRALAVAVKGILHIQTGCRAKIVAVIVSKITVRILVKLSDVVESAIDREETLTARAGIPGVEARPA